LLLHGVHCAGLSDVHGASRYAVPREAAFFSASGAALSQEFVDGKFNVQSACALNILCLILLNFSLIELLCFPIRNSYFRPLN
jgi:hypothetical protein